MCAGGARQVRATPMACRSDELRAALPRRNALEDAAGEIVVRAWVFLTEAFLRQAVVRQASRLDFQGWLTAARDQASATRASPRSDRRSSRPPSVNPAAPPNPRRRRFHTTQLNAV